MNVSGREDKESPIWSQEWYSFTNIWPRPSALIGSYLNYKFSLLKYEYYFHSEQVHVLNYTTVYPCNRWGEAARAGKCETFRVSLFIKKLHSYEWQCDQGKIWIYNSDTNPVLVLVLYATLIFLIDSTHSSYPSLIVYFLF